MNDAQPSPAGTVAEAMYETIVRNAPDAHLVVTRDGVIVAANVAATKMFSSRIAHQSRPVHGDATQCPHVGAFAGANVLDLVPASERPRLATFIEQYLRAPQALTLGEVPTPRYAQTLDGFSFPIEIALLPIATPPAFAAPETAEQYSITVRDVSARRREESRFKMMLEAAPDAVVIFDSEGAISFVNSHAERMFGYLRSELINTTVTQLIPEGIDIGRHRGRYTAQSSVHADHRRVQAYGIRRDGEEFPADVAVAALHTEEGLFLSAAIRDVSDRERLRTQAQRVREEVIATVNHELRTPLTSIMGYTEMLLDLGEDELSHEARALLKIIERNATRELALVNDLLTLAAGSTPKGASIEIDVCELVRTVVAGSARRLDQLDLTIVEDLEGVATVPGDCDGLTQVVENLLSNATKFTPRGGRIEVRARIEGRTVVLEVADNGVGIDDDEQSLIFERLWRSPSAVAAQIQGAGLGLPIVKAIVEDHQGAIEVDSTIGRGTTIRVRLPRFQPHDD